MSMVMESKRTFRRQLTIIHWGENLMALELEEYYERVIILICIKCVVIVRNMEECMKGWFPHPLQSGLGLK